MNIKQTIFQLGVNAKKASNLLANIPGKQKNIALDKLKAKGADIDLITIQGGNHSSSVFESYSKALDWFNSLK